MRTEHIVDGFWEMPGDVDLDLGWPGTKNKMSHRVWLSEPVRKVIAEFEPDHGFVFVGSLP